MSAGEKSGGRCHVNVGGKPYSPRGEISFRTAGLTKEANANYDGTVYVNTAAAPVIAEITFSDHFGVSVDELVNGCHDVTFDCFDRGVRHFFTQAHIVGEPQVNAATGEISGITIAVPKARHRRQEYQAA